MQRPRKQLLLAGDLDDASQVHDGHPMPDVFDNAEVVADEEVGELQVILEVHHQVQDLGLHGDVESGDGLVGDDQ